MLALLLIPIFIALAVSGLALLPDSVGFPPDVLSSFNHYFAIAYKFNHYFPIDTLFTVLGLTVGFQVAVFLFKVFYFIIIRIVRGAGGP